MIHQVNWLGLKTLYMKEVRRFFKVQTQTIWAPAITTVLQLMIFTLALGRGERPPGPAQGVVFGAGVWATSLGMLPALGLAEAPWRRPVAALAQDLGFHLVYGAATAAAYEAFTA